LHPNPVDGPLGQYFVEVSRFAAALLLWLDGLRALEESNPNPVGQRSNGPFWLVCQSGTLWFLPNHDVL
jgi:hypothetical protein